MEALLIQQVLVPLLFTALSSVLGWGGVELSRWVRTKTKNEKAAALVQHLVSLVEGAVQQVEMQYRPNVPTHYLTGNGKLTNEGQQAAQKEARELIKNQLPRSGLKAIKHLVPDVDAFIGNQIERVMSNKILPSIIYGKE